jgi:hypothetical protein
MGWVEFTYVTTSFFILHIYFAELCVMLRLLR